MKDEKKIIVILVVAVIFTIWIIAEKATSAKQIAPRIIGVKPQGDINVGNLSSIPINVEVALNNFGKSNVNLNQIYLEIYNEKGTELIAQQTNPIPETLKIPSNKNIIVKIPFVVSLANLVNFLFNGDKVQASLNLARFAVGGKLNKKILIKGFVRGEGIKVNLNILTEL